MGFDQYIDKILELEGGLTNDPDDPGGLTNFGIDQRDNPGVDVANLTREAAKAIYFKDPWLLYYCHYMPDEIQFAYFDACVNQGGPTAVTLLQRCLGVGDDGAWGPITQAAVTKMGDMSIQERMDILKAFLARRMNRYGQSAGFTKFGLGWSNRLMEVARLSFAVRGN